ncbi:hypothetical protein Kpho01_61610 [Kitasatospora phosalacinea]|uniref:Uncharacterized protein n=1 Tax=Kitasatospora phosalacinea TaxID=2065 RepID=A0A9W6PNB5_9ACTN|nr:hypothetical protein Kpho01_61610 [Kitasatospora phosalacinea]
MSGGVHLLSAGLRAVRVADAGRRFGARGVVEVLAGGAPAGAAELLAAETVVAVRAASVRAAVGAAWCRGGGPAGGSVKTDR